MLVPGGTTAAPDRPSLGRRVDRNTFGWRSAWTDRVALLRAVGTLPRVTLWAVGLAIRELAVGRSAKREAAVRRSDKRAPAVLLLFIKTLRAVVPRGIADVELRWVDLTVVEAGKRTAVRGCGDAMLGRADRIDVDRAANADAAVRAGAATDRVLMAGARVTVRGATVVRAVVRGAVACRVTVLGAEMREAAVRAVRTERVDRAADTREAVLRAIDARGAERAEEMRDDTLRAIDARGADRAEEMRDDALRAIDAREADRLALRAAVLPWLSAGCGSRQAIKITTTCHRI